MQENRVANISGVEIRVEFALENVVVTLTEDGAILPENSSSEINYSCPNTVLS